MGSSPSLNYGQAQCAVKTNRGQTCITCKYCGNSNVQWKCEECESIICKKCERKYHSAAGHNTIDIIQIQVNISEVKEYPTKVDLKTFLVASWDGSLWIGNGATIDGFHPFTTPTSLQNIKLVGDKVKLISSFDLKVLAIAVTPTNDILLATLGPNLKQIKAGSNKVTDSIYCAELYFICTLHVTKDGRVIVCDNKVVLVMDTDGKHLTRYEKDKHNKTIFCGTVTSITGTDNGNIFMASERDRKVVVFMKTDIISIYCGHPTVNTPARKFFPSSVVTTPLDNVIVADCSNHALHILNGSGNLLTTYNTADIGISFPNQLAITEEESQIVLYMRIRMSKSLYKMVFRGY